MKKSITIVLSLVILVVCVGIGYSYLNQNLSVQGKGFYNIWWGLLKISTFF